MSASDFLFQLIHFPGKEFHGTAALRANHMVMTAPVVLVFEAGNAIVEGDFAGESTLRQQLERAINRGVTNASIFLLHQAVQFISGEMVSGFQKRSQDRIALCRLLQADTLKMPVEDFLGFAHHLAGNRRLIIDALLQHERKG